MLRYKQESLISNTTANKNLNAEANKAVKSDKKRITIANKKLNTIANKRIDIDKKQNTIANK